MTISNYEECVNDCLQSTATMSVEDLRKELATFGHCPPSGLTAAGLRKELCSLRCDDGGGGEGAVAEAETRDPATQDDEPEYSISVLQQKLGAGHTKK